MDTSHLDPFGIRIGTTDDKVAHSNRAPTTGVDPLPRRQFWDLIASVRAERPSMSVLVSTAYMDEADGFDWLYAMDAGKVLAGRTPDEIKAQTETDSLEDAFVALLPEEVRAAKSQLTIPPRPGVGHEAAIVAEGLTRRFGPSSQLWQDLDCYSSLPV